MAGYVEVPETSDAAGAAGAADTSEVAAPGGAVDNPGVDATSFAVTFTQGAGQCVPSSGRVSPALRIFVMELPAKDKLNATSVAQVYSGRRVLVRRLVLEDTVSTTSMRKENSHDS